RLAVYPVYPAVVEARAIYPWIMLVRLLGFNGGAARHPHAITQREQRLEVSHALGHVSSRGQGPGLDARLLSERLRLRASGKRWGTRPHPRTSASWRSSVSRSGYAACE